MSFLADKTGIIDFFYESMTIIIFIYYLLLGKCDIEVTSSMQDLWKHMQTGQAAWLMSFATSLNFHCLLSAPSVSMWRSWFKRNKRKTMLFYQTLLSHHTRTLANQVHYNTLHLSKEILKFHPRCQEISPKSYKCKIWSWHRIYREEKLKQSSYHNFTTIRRSETTGYFMESSLYK